MDARDYLFMADLFPEIPRPRVGPSLAVISVPVGTAAPVISGTPEIGQVLSCTTGSWAFNPTEYIYHWRRDGKAISGASASTYTVVSPDVGKDITCAVVAVNEQGQSNPAVSNTISIPLPDVPVNTVAPVISGTTTPGSTLSCTTGTWDNDPISYAYLWKRDGVGVTSGSTYLLAVIDTGKSITCEVTATNANGPSAPQVSNTLAIPSIVPVNTVAPVISGTATVGQTLTSTTGTWTNTPTSYSYQWKRDGVSIGSATASTYLLVTADGGTSITCTVTAINAGGSASANSNALSIAALPTAPANTVAPVISGTVTVTSILSCTTGTWTNTPTSYAYQWKRNGTNIGSATLSTYTLVSADASTNITCAVTATNAAGSSSPATSNTLAIDAESGSTLATPELDLKASSDTGSSSTDNITSDTTPTLTVTFPDSLLTGDHIIVRDNLVQVNDHTVTSGEAGGTPIDLGLAAMAHGSHSITVRQERGAAISDWSAALVITVDAVGPTMTSGTSANCAENATLSFALTASETSTFAITSGADAARFEISGSTLRWLGNSTKDFETPNDADTNNTYICAVTPTATLSGKAGTAQTITITVTDVTETVDFATWDPSNKSTGATLSNGNRTATLAGGGYHSVRSNVGKSSGKWYWEYTVTTLVYAPGAGPGFCGTAMLFNQGGPFAADGASLQYLNNGGLYAEGGGFIPLDADRDYVATNVLGMRFDADTATVGIRNITTGGAWATVALSTMVTPPSPPWFAAGFGVDGDTFTINCGQAAFVGAVPSGYAGLAG